ncbi:amino acid transporter [Pradoshia sp. D12]|uniref:LysE family transporter n=1 Tax=Bacillaceae TaxID=186817 RepID=UPI00080AD167|nr:MULTISPECIES: LysE family transporter [Bacillaceae]OCA81117.1 amino acid transporter [Bacillus sp. FJAT-27986]QFK73049.1 amino acid transporter [Pradoshia sp. D12]TPF72041.1 amino acid transporter [Bacillus sp. D12]
MYGLLGYVYLGISLSAPIGPINAAQMEIGLRHGFLNAWVFGLGAILADICYMLVVYTGLAQYMQVPLIQTFLWLFGAFVLTYSGVESLVAVYHKKNQSNIRNKDITRSFRSGFFMSLLNPLSILFWLGIYGSVLAKTVSHLSPQQIIINSLAILLGILIWDYSMAMMASIFRRYLTNKLLAGISIISGISLVGFGIYFGVMGVQSLI